MKVSPRKVQTAKQMARVEPVPMAEPQRLPAPIRGWVLNESLANPQPGGARRLDNWICGETTIRVRGGTAKFATIGTTRVTSMFTYKTGAAEDFFAATADSLFEVTSPASATVVPTALAEGLSGGDWNTQQFATAGGEFLYAVNGSDLAMLYDGTDWNPVNGAAVNEISYDALSSAFTVGSTLTGGTSGASATILAIMPTSATEGVLKIGAVTSGPFQDNEALTDAATGAATANGANSAASTVTITGVTTSDLSHVWSFASRLWFVESGTQSAWYLPVDSIGGAATEFSLAGTFRRGGALLFGAAWSTDAGDGLNDQCVFVSTEGEVVIYRGTNPASASTWSLVGVYDIGEPIGAKATMKAGGDLMIATKVGLVPLSEAIRRDVAALSLGAVSRAIEPEWRRQAQALTTEWQIAKWPAENIMVVTQPESSVTLGTCLVANMQTGAWSRFTGIDTQSAANFAGTVYFGTSDGVIFEMQSGGQDDATPYTAAYLGQAENLGLPGVQKTVKMARPMIVSDVPVNAQFGCLTDYREELPSPPNASTVQPTEGWDISVWDVSVWDASSGGVTATDSQWISVGATGYAHAPVLQMTFGSTAAPTVEYIGADVTIQAGAMVA